MATPEDQQGVADTAKDAVGKLVDAGQTLVDTAVEVSKDTLELALSEAEKLVEALRSRIG